MYCYLIMVHFDWKCTLIAPADVFRYVAMSEETHSLNNMQGFGDPSGEHWLGNDVIHLLTISRDYTLQVRLEDVDGNQAYSQYDHFYINEEEKKYRY